MDANFICGEKIIENVTDFKHLGLIINRAQNNPGQMLNHRISRAKAAFYSIKCHARLLGLHNRRVRISLVQAIAVSTLLYGSVIFGCLGKARL